MKRCNVVLELLVALVAFVTVPLAAIGQSSDIVLSPAFIDFGEVAVGDSSSDIITIYNGGAPIELDDYYILPESPHFSITLGPPTPYWLESGDSVEVEVIFSPSVVGQQSTLFWVEPGLSSILLTGFGKEKDSHIEVSHSAIDFGEVAVGGSSTETIIISSTGSDSLLLTGIVIEDDPDFAVTSSPSMPFEVESGEFVYVDVTFSPSDEGDHGAFLTIESDALAPADDIPLTGMGVVVELPPEEQIADILAFVDTSVGAGTLQGDGPGASAPKRLNALTNMLEAAAGLIEEGLYEEAYQQLMAAYRKTDGAGRPPDFVAGDAASALAEMIQALLDSL